MADHQNREQGLVRYEEFLAVARLHAVYPPDSPGENPENKSVEVWPPQADSSRTLMLRVGSPRASSALAMTVVARWQAGPNGKEEDEVNALRIVNLLDRRGQFVRPVLCNAGSTRPSKQQCGQAAGTRLRIPVPSCVPVGKPRSGLRGPLAHFRFCAQPRAATSASHDESSETKCPPSHPKWILRQLSAATGEQANCGFGDGFSQRSQSRGIENGPVLELATGDFFKET